MILGLYVYNFDRDAWLQSDKKSWGRFSRAAEFTEGNEILAEEIGARAAPNDVLYVMAALS